METSLSDGKLKAEQELKECSIAEIKRISNRAKVGLTVIGEGVLFKKIPDASELSLMEIVKKAFPFMKSEEFYAQVYKSSTDVFVSVIRRETLRGILKQLSEVSIYPYSVTVGPFVFSQILPLLPPSSISQVNGYEIHHDSIHITEVRNAAVRMEEQVTVVKDIQTQASLSLATVLFVLSPGPMEFEGYELIQGLRKQHRYKSFYYSVTPIALFGFFFLLAINTVFYQKQFAINNELKETHSAAIAVRNRLDAITVQYNSKKSFIDSLGLMSSLRIAFYADRLAKDLPEGILLDQLSFYPVVKKFDTEKVEFEKNKIRIKGTCRNPAVLQQWIGVVQGYPWIFNTEGQKYFFNEEKNIGEFELGINLRE